jgi:hypothetical protein
LSGEQVGTLKTKGKQPAVMTITVWIGIGMLALSVAVLWAMP